MRVEKIFLSFSILVSVLMLSACGAVSTTGNSLAASTAALAPVASPSATPQSTPCNGYQVTLTADRVNRFGTNASDLSNTSIKYGDLNYGIAPNSNSAIIQAIHQWRTTFPGTIGFMTKNICFNGTFTSMQQQEGPFLITVRAITVFSMFDL